LSFTKDVHVQNSATLGVSFIGHRIHKRSLYLLNEIPGIQNVPDRGGHGFYLGIYKEYLV